MQSKPYSFTHDVIISGAGPVGLFLACELALAKCSVLILERAENPDSPLKQAPFGIRGLNAPSIEALYRRGLLGELKLHQQMKNPHVAALSRPGEPPRRQVGHFAGIPFYESDIDAAQWQYRLPSSTAPSLLSDMAEIETMLTRRAETLGVEIKRGFAVTGYKQTPEGVMVQCGDQTFYGKWLVGCDGSRSVVRKSSGFDVVGTEPEFTGYSLQVELDDPQKILPGRHMTSRGMYLQSQPGYLNLQDFDGGAFHDSGKPITREHVQGVLRRISNLDVNITTLHIATTWTDRARQATNYRSGRILLAGDAAHIHSPLGGQGLNLGLGDAMNLGWKLAATIHEKAPEGLLDSYTTERHPVGEKVLDWSRAQVAIMNPSPQARALNAILRDLMSTRDGATYFAGRVWGIHTRYDLGGDHPLVGCSVPNFEFEDGTTIGDLMHDGQAILLDFDGSASLREWADEYTDRFQYVSRPVKETFGLTTTLIRPDGFVAWASDGKADEQSLRQTIARWFTR